MTKYRAASGWTFTLSQMDLDEYALAQQEQLTRIRNRERDAEIEWKRSQESIDAHDASWDRMVAERVSNILNAERIG